MFDIMKYAATNHVEVDVRPGIHPVVWEIFIRDRGLDLVQFKQILERDLERQYNIDLYLEKCCDTMMAEISEARHEIKLRTA